MREKNDIAKRMRTNANQNRKDCGELYNVTSSAKLGCSVMKTRSIERGLRASGASSSPVVFISYILLLRAFRCVIIVLL